MQWRHSGSPHPKKFRGQKSAGKFLASIFRDQDGHPPQWLSSKGPNYPTRSIIHLCWCNWRTFWRKNAAVRSPRGFVLARQCPGSQCTCNPEQTDLPGLPVSWSPTLFPGSGPVGLPPVPWTEKTNERSTFFFRREGHCCRRDLVGRTTFLIIFWVACKS